MKINDEFPLRDFLAGLFFLALMGIIALNESIESKNKAMVKIAEIEAAACQTKEINND